MKSYIVGNWKMNFSVGESSVYLHKLQQKIRAFRSVEVIVAPSLVALQPLSLQVEAEDTTVVVDLTVLVPAVDLVILII